ncbi:sulfatase [Jatrophihabitans fulvus]
MRATDPSAPARPSPSSTGAGPLSNAPATGVRPNIVFVLTDDLSYDLLRFMPSLRALRTTGMALRNHFVVDSLCCPSRASIFTGRYPHNTGVRKNEGPAGGYDAFVRNGDDSRSYGLALQRAGYRTGFMGKYLNGYHPDDPIPPGWDDWVSTGDGYRGFDYTLNENGRLRYYGYEPKDYLTDVLSTKARAFISSAADEGTPFALEVSTFAPHHPFVPAPRDADMYPGLKAPRDPSYGRRTTDAPSWLAAFPKLTKLAATRMDSIYRQRARSVRAVDRLIADIRSQLVRSGVQRDTYLIFSSDNGFHLGQHRLRSGKMTAYDSDIHVPLIVAGPGVAPNSTATALTTSIDLAPTFEQIAGADPDPARDGVSMLPVWLGRTPADWTQATLVEHAGGDFAPSDPDKQPRLSGNPPTYRALRTRDALYVEYVNGDREYYDLKSDPYELHNVVAGTPVSVLAPLQRAVAALDACAGAESCQAAARLAS